MVFRKQSLGVGYIHFCWGVIASVTFQQTYPNNTCVQMHIYINIHSYSHLCVHTYICMCSGMNVHTDRFIVDTDVCVCVYTHIYLTLSNICVLYVFLYLFTYVFKNHKFILVPLIPTLHYITHYSLPSFHIFNSFLRQNPGS